MTDLALRFGAEGVGLYRSEFLFLHLAPDLPSEEDHRATYRQLADHAQSRPERIALVDQANEVRGWTLR